MFLNLEVYLKAFELEKQNKKEICVTSVFTNIYLVTK